MPYHKIICPGGNEMPWFTLLYIQFVSSMPMSKEKILKKLPMYINFTLLPQNYLPMWGHKIYNFLSQSYTIQILWTDPAILEKKILTDNNGHQKPQH